MATSCKAKILVLKSIEILRNNVSPKKSIHRSTWKGEIDRIVWQNWKHKGWERRGSRKGSSREREGGGELKEPESQDRGRAEMRTRKEIFDWVSCYGAKCSEK